MMKEKTHSFNSKILLFGEYSLMKGSMALSIPYDKFSGKLTFESEKTVWDKHFSRPYLIYYLKFLQENHLESIINTNEFESDLDNGLIFECNIPISYGLGSSGAVVASIYNAYARNHATDLLELKRVFSAMESFYHGQSSGLDPLVSYLDKAVLIDDFGTLQKMDIPSLHTKNDEGVFLLDTKVSGETQPLVDWFLKKYESKEFHDLIQNQLITTNNHCINNFLEGYFDSIFNCVKQTSVFTFDHFKPMIPDSIKEIWYSGLYSDEYYLKLCGSGGGGMVLGFSKNLDSTIKKLKDYNTHILTF